MQLEQRDKELAAIGASIGSNCEPCIEHHLAAARDAGLTGAELDDAVATAHAVRRRAVMYLSARIEELLGHDSGAAAPIASDGTSKTRELVALGVCVGANSHPLLRGGPGVNMSSTAFLADMWDTNGHMGGGWWIVMMIWMVLFWGAVIYGVVWLARGNSSGWPRADRRETPLEILDRRFAEGGITADEYHERREVLTRGGARNEGPS